MINKLLKLQLNSRLSSINSINTINNILIDFNRRNPKLLIDYHLYDRYSTLCLLRELLDLGYINDNKYLSNNKSTRYSDLELMVIGNIIYNLKGSVESILLFCKFFNLKVYEISVGYSSVFIINTDLVADDLNKFRILFTQLINELLLSDGVKIKINQWTLNAVVNNDISINLSGTVVNYIRLIGK